MIAAQDLSKRFGAAVAVDGLTFALRPGAVTALLGPNGAGKSTTLRLALGLDRPTRGTVTVGGRAYRDLEAPLREVGALLDPRAAHPGRTARAHLRWVAAAGALPVARADELLERVGLAGVAGRRARGLSLGMAQRLGVATALLGDPATLLLDEPMNGLDPEGVAWMRGLLRGLAAEGRAVLVSSHLLREMEETADRVLVLGRGRLVADTTMGAFREGGSASHVRVLSPDAGRLGALLERAGARVAPGADGALAVTGVGAPAVGDLAAEHGLRVHELTPCAATLEAAYAERTRESVELRARATS